MHDVDHNKMEKLDVGQQMDVGQIMNKGQRTDM